MVMGTVTGKDAGGATKTMLAATNDSGHLAAATVAVNEHGVVVSTHVHPTKILNTYLLNGGSNAMNIDGTTPVTFKYTVPADTVLELHRMIIYLDDASAFIAAEFGGIGSALTNGIEISASGTLFETWKDNIDMVTTFHDFPGYKSLAKEDKSGSGRWTFRRSFGGPIEMEAADEFKIVINDNLTGLTSFRAKIQGRLLSV